LMKKTTAIDVGCLGDVSLPKDIQSMTMIAMMRVLGTLIILRAVVVEVVLPWLGPLVDCGIAGTRPSGVLAGREIAIDSGSGVILSVIISLPF
jgi:hypothetical protein